MVLYHGSVTPGISALQPVSALHGSPEDKVVYLTGSAPYALFYIWDAQHNKKAGKHVTCRLQNGVVYYEEQFDGQLRAFYQGVSGWLYRAEGTEISFRYRTARACGCAATRFRCVGLNSSRMSMRPSCAALKKGMWL